jgi:hypothetical protein
MRKRQIVTRFGWLFDVDEPSINPEDDDRIAIAALALLGPQISMLGFKLEQVPPEGDFVSDKCRGYLFGLSAGILICEGMSTDSDGPALRTLKATFRVVYGAEQCTRLAVETVKDTAAGKRNVVWASELAIQEVRNIYLNGGKTRGNGFHLAASRRI